MRRALRVAPALLALGACRRPAPPPSLTLSVPYQIDTLDPHARDRLGNAAIAAHFYEPLVAFDAEMGIHPALAERWESPDLLTWVFHLRSGVRFHGGRALTAEDVVYTFDRLANVAKLEVGLYVVQIRSVRALDPMTVEIRTRRPLGILLNKLAAVPVVPKGSGESLATQVDGTGPYRLVAFEPGRLRLRRNDAYRVAPGSSPPAAVDVTILLGRGAAEAGSDFSAGRCDVAQVPGREIARSLERVPGATISRRPELFVKALGFDVVPHRTPFVPGDANPFAARAVREAVSLALDRKALAERLPSSALPASQLVPPYVFGFDPSLPAAVHDPERARRLLAEAGYAAGFEVTLHARKRLVDAAREVAAQLAPVGIRVTVAELSDGEFFEMAESGRLSFILISFGCASGDVSDLLDAGFHSVDAARRFGTSNFGRFSDPSLDEAIERSAEILEAGDRRETLFGIVRRAMSEHVLVPLYLDENVFAVRRPFAYRPRASSFVLAADVGLADPRAVPR